ncbi:MAG TPA: hypothetical protein VE441_09340 [Mycobacterium sp.]|nr:hypothetical protein [Mycobacterium sp.]
MTRPIGRFAGCMGLVAAVALAGCSSSGGNDPSATGPASSGSGAGANTTAQTAIKHAYQLFFDSTGPTRQGVNTLQHGARFRSTIIGESSTSYGKQKTKATVSAVRVVNAKLADVTFSIVVGGQTLLPNSHGFAVREGGRWKVAAQTFCSLLKLQGTAPPLCKNKSITALPSGG